MDLTEIGNRLREGRQSKGLTVEEAAEKIKISSSVIIALEEGNREKFPHPVYARGFVRSYASLLGFDHAELCAEFAREYPVEEDHEPPSSGTGISVRAYDSGRTENLLRFVIVLVILGLGVGGWILFDEYRSRTPLGAQNAVTETPPVSSAPVRREQSDAVSHQMTQMQEVTEGLAVNQTANTSVETETVMPVAESAETAVNATQPAAAERVLVIRANAASWLQARPDGRVVDYFLRKGESASIAFARTLSVKFGNAGGVALELDGQPYPFQAAAGEVKTLVVQ
ncbi:MAG: DUF4115 domain-containing protein [Pseudomonadota bacterium]|nr:DUF4115 domain-containing protein [Pseudomonadota bacterium]